MKPKASTLQERMGFRDDELSTPKHDEIMLWLDENAERLAPWMASQHPYHRSAAQKLKAEHPDLKDHPIFPPNGVKVEEKTWEWPVKNRNEYIVGFVDMRIKMRTLAEIGYSVTESGGVVWKWKEGWNNFNALIEVKPSISSVGELIRQIRAYQTSVSGIGPHTLIGPAFYVCCPDDRVSGILADQGIGFIKAEV